MEEEKSEQLKNEYLIQHIERFEGRPVVRRVIGKETSFEGEIEGFYDIESWWESGFRVPPYEVYGLCDENPEKTGKTPGELIEILDDFCKEELDVSKLRYELVREDYERWHDNSRKTKMFFTALGTSGLGTLAICISSIRALNGDPAYYSIPLGLLGAASIGLGFWSSSHYPDPEGTNNELDEYKKLLRGARTADTFMDERYRKDFINKALERDL